MCNCAAYIEPTILILYIVPIVILIIIKINFYSNNGNNFDFSTTELTDSYGYEIIFSFPS